MKKKTSCVVVVQYENQESKITEAVSKPMKPEKAEILSRRYQALGHKSWTELV